MRQEVAAHFPGKIVPMNAAGEAIHLIAHCLNSCRAFLFSRPDESLKDKVTAFEPPALGPIH